MAGRRRAAREVRRLERPDSVACLKQEVRTIRRLADKQGDPTAKDGIVGAFCRTYSVEDAIEAFLPDVYIKGENGRYTYKGGSTSGRSRYL